MKNKPQSKQQKFQFNLRRTSSLIVLHFIGISMLTVLYTNCDQQSGFKITQKNAATNTTTPPSPTPTPTPTPTPLDGGTDPLMKYAWHLQNNGQSVFATTAGVSGSDLQLQNTWSSGIYGNNIKIQLSDDGIEDTHEDLNENFLYDNTSKDYYSVSPFTRSSSPPQTVHDNHGTNVAGLIAAVKGNNKGSAGVAPKAKLTSANFLSPTTITETYYLDQATGNFDISNMSWGSPQFEITPPDSAYESVLKNQVQTKRGGNGSIFVKAAGNDFVVGCNADRDLACVGNSNFDADNSIPYLITVAALNALGNSTSYSSAGSNIWISGFGGEFGDDSPAMLTSDRSGCTAGYATSNSSSTLAFEKGGNENPACNYSATFNGTSSAAPTITGSVALLLEANPNLTWRDVKYILAKTATTVHFNTTNSISHPLGKSVPTGYKWELPWVVNAAGFKFHNWYGFGRVNVDAAVQLAKNYNVNLGTYTETDWANKSAENLDLAIHDNSAQGASNILTVSQNLKIEAVQIKLWVTHPDISELAVELTSPAGTKSIIINMKNALTGVPDYVGDMFLTNAFFQESSAGNWTLKVIDGNSNKTGTLTQWQINFVGANQ